MEGNKRKAGSDLPGGSTKKAAKGQLVNPSRVRVLKSGTQQPGPVIYW